MLPYRDSKIIKSLLVVFFLLVLAYAYFEAQGFLFGPRINVGTEITEVNEKLVHIKGRADRISSLAMNGKEISVTEEGAFDEPYLLAEGLNRITLDATDKYGRRTSRVLQIVYTPTESPRETAATSTLATSTPPAGGPVAQ